MANHAFDAGVDGATARLIAAAKATQATEGLPTTSGRRLVNQARGVRLYLEARQPRLARTALDDLIALVKSSGEPDLIAAYDELAKGLRSITRWEPSTERTTTP